MARSFDGTNDNLLSADNAIPDLDADQKSWSLWFNHTSSGQDVIVTGITANGAGNARITLVAATPTTAGYRFQLEQSWTSATGTWRVDADTPDNERHHLAVVFDRALSTNDPTFYIDGASAAFTETVAPSGTLNTGEDTLKVGEGTGGAGDLSGIVNNLSIGDQLWDAAQVNRARWWGRQKGSLLVYHPLWTPKLADEGEAGETLTASGTTMVSLVTPCVRPGTAMLGMGIGW